MKLSSRQKSKLDALNLKPVKGVRGYSTFTPEEAQKLREFYLAEGVTYEDIARYIDVSKGTVQDAINRHHKFSRQTWLMLTPEQTEAMREAYRQGVALTSIAIKYDVPYTTVQRIVKDLVPQYGKKPRMNPEKLASIRKDYIGGMSYADMGKKYNRTKSSFYRYIADLMPEYGRKGRR